MKSSQKVIDYLNFLLAGELGARDQYFIHSQMYAEWELGKLHDRIYHEMEDETLHARLIINRIIMLGGTPNMQVGEINIGADVPAMLQSDLNLEYTVQEHLKEGIAICEAERDYVTRDMLVRQLEDTEQDHAHWLEKQLRLIKLMGLQNYLQSQTAKPNTVGAAH
ncbi:bacterioferritin [Moraxella bovoculi]|uniref:Bacterioferritin n=1 Tax=Moraxella bovoculi TaxID=386891 RepID=A0AAC8T7Y5_9GAMM|nr:bacterioferritin [Moraxella bovoculi]AKG07747.1 bacterioferritin [Moraxella bovoculi]AKG09655.1 bacterioferritin [Moraxella bovoculi]AKG11572.1 bacterioferritin [Moraxella bovoculi]AKG13537.1 bacterioferritin [Moraxella bovoculi]